VNQPIDTRAERLARRIADLYATDQQFAGARSSEAITAAIGQPGLRLPQLVQTVMEGYAERAALAQRAVQFVTDPATDRTSLQLLPRFETVTYREAWQRAGAVASALADAPALFPGDRVCVLGCTSVDYTIVELALIQLGAVAAPLQTSAPLSQLRPIVAETEPRLIAASVDYLYDAVELVLTGPAPARLVVFDYHPRVDDQREALDAARARLAQGGSPVIVQTLAEVLERGQVLPPAPMIVSDEEDDPLRLLLYTSGSTGTPKFAAYPERWVANHWHKSSIGWGDFSSMPSITLNVMQMSHLLGRTTLFATLGSGGTVYFAAKSDLSALLEDFALVRPTKLMFAPRIWEMLLQQFQSEVHRRSFDGINRAALEAHVMAEQRQNILGGRFVWAMTGSAPMSAEMTAFVESYLDLHLFDGYGPTEYAGVMVDGQVRRPPGMKAPAAQNETRIQAVRADMQQPASTGGGLHGAGFGAGRAIAPGPEQPRNRVDMSAGSVVVCEPHNAGDGFTCFEWFLDGRVETVWGPDDVSGGYLRPLNTEELFVPRSARGLQDRLDTYMTYLLIVVLSVLIAVLVARS
jgi:fatty acid CoA ligase FadD9